MDKTAKRLAGKQGPWKGFGVGLRLAAGKHNHFQNNELNALDGLANAAEEVRCFLPV
jgi:hypothetical protein